MSQVARLLTALLLLTLLAAHSASAVTAPLAAKPASGSFGVLEHRLGVDVLASAGRINEKSALRYDFASGSLVAARGTTAAAREIGILRDALRGKGNFGLGSGTRAEAERLGRAWVGDGYRVASDGKTLISSDGLRQFRPPSFKPNLGINQANFERRLTSEGQWLGNGHLDVIP